MTKIEDRNSMPEYERSEDVQSPLTPLTVENVVAIARHNRKMDLLKEGDNPRFERAANWVAAAMDSVAQQENPIAYYGINTGFGDNAGRATFRRVEDAERLSRNLLLSHTTGVGEPLAEDVVRAAMAIRISSLAKGYSGVRRVVINTLIEMLNRRVYPYVPTQGSLGASGDLAPLAHLVIPMSAPGQGEDVDRPGATGYCFLNGTLVSGAEAMERVGLEQVRLGAKEGVALINGTAISLALGVLALHDAYQVLAGTEAALSMCVDAMRGFRDAFLPYANRLRSSYQEKAADNVLGYLEGSTLTRGGATIDLSPEVGPPQDPYSMRCAPAVLGAAMRALEHVESILADELSAVTDNPLVFVEDDPHSPDYLPRATKVISGGNFHGEPLALAMDYLAIAVAELANIAERRIFMLTDPRLNRGLPPFLTVENVDTAGLNSGLMIAQYTAASLVSENKSLAHPASVDSIPSSANREDHVSMSSIAARKAATIVANTRKVVAIELLCAAQALSLRLEHNPGLSPGHGAKAILSSIRSLEIAPGRQLDVIREDVPLMPYIGRLEKALRMGEIVNAIHR
jgi:histidine ammonia-lyase